MAERTFAGIIQPELYLKGSSVRSAELALDADVTRYQVLIDRDGWPDLGKPIINVLVELSLDAGKSWQRWGGCQTHGGIKVHRFGFTQNYTTLACWVPQSLKQRLLRMTVTALEPLLLGAVDLDCLVEPYRSPPRQRSVHNSVAFLDADSAASGAAVSSITTPAIDGTGSDRAVVAAVEASSSAGANITGVTWDVASPENLAEKVITTFLGSYGTLELWGLGGQTSATDTLTATCSATVDEFIIAGHSFTGVDQTTAFGNTQSGTGTTAEPSETLTTVASDDMCIDAVACYPDNTFTPGADQTERVDTVTTGSYFIGLATSTQPGTAGGVMTWTVGGAPNWSHVAMVVKAAAGGAVDADLDAAGEATATFVGQSSAGAALSAPGEATASFGGAAIAASVLEAEGEAAATFTGKALFDGVLSGAAEADASFTGHSTADAVLSAPGEATATFDGSSLAAAVLTAQGEADVVLVAESMADGVLSATGEADADLVGEGVAEGSALAAPGEATAAFTGSSLAAAVLQALGEASAFLVGRADAAAVWAAAADSTGSFVGESVAQDTGSLSAVGEASGIFVGEQLAASVLTAVAEASAAFTGAVVGLVFGPGRITTTERQRGIAASERERGISSTDRARGIDGSDE